VKAMKVLYYDYIENYVLDKHFRQIFTQDVDG